MKNSQKLRFNLDYLLKLSIAFDIKNSSLAAALPLKTSPNYCILFTEQTFYI